MNLDLYAQQSGVGFTDVSGWNAMVGGSPTNVAIAVSRLGLRAAAFTAVGEDLVGDWVLAALEREGVDTRFIARKEGPHTSLALRAQLAPDHPLAFYRQDPADIHLTRADAVRLPVDEARALLISADAFARGSTPEVCVEVAELGRAAGVTIFLDLDLRDVNWSGPEAYAAAVSEVTEAADVIVGTEEEFATLLNVGSTASVEVLDAVGERFDGGRHQVVIIKQGERGALALVEGGSLKIESFPADEVSSVGAGDSFAAGLIRGRLDGLDWEASGVYASACAAITVSRPGCSSGFPYRDELERFVAAFRGNLGAAR